MFPSEEEREKESERENEREERDCICIEDVFVLAPNVFFAYYTADATSPCVIANKLNAIDHY